MKVPKEIWYLGGNVKKKNKNKREEEKMWSAVVKYPCFGMWIFVNDSYCERVLPSHDEW